jgi:hypothetical protein
MRTLILKSSLLILFCLSLISLNCYSLIIINEDTKLLMDKSCFTKGLENLKKKYPTISEDNAKFISIYGCTCAFKESKKTLLSTEAKDYRSARNCIHYAVLRNAIRTEDNSASEENTNGEGIYKSCNANFPHDVTDDSVTGDIAHFCKCASTPTKNIYDEIKPLKLDEDQIYKKLISLINGCRYSI